MPSKNPTMISAFQLFRVVGALAAIVVAAGLASMQSPPIARGGTDGMAYTVNTLADDDNDDDLECSLREAINASNTDAIEYYGCISVPIPGTDDNAISFSLTGPNPKIDILTPLPAITRTVAINGATGGATRVELQGPGGSFVNEFDGLRINGGDNSAIKSLIINNFPARGINVAAANVVIVGNRIGTDAAGSAAVPNFVGIYITGSGTQIGRPTGASLGSSCTGDCNLISGNSSHGIQSSGSASNTVIRANFIGTDVSGTADLGNSFGGIWAGDGMGLQIGGLSPNEGNLVSGNGDGILANGPAAQVLANRVGTNSAGDAAIPNSNRGVEMRGASNGIAEANLISGNGYDGLFIVQSSGVHVRRNLIGVALDGVSPLGNLNNGVWIATASVNYVGSTNASDANTIAFNASDGVRIDAASAPTSGNAVRGNSIHDNGGQGINNVNGGNGEPPPPVITAATPSGASGTAASCGPCAIEVYSDNADEGRVYEGTTQTDVAGNWSFVGPLAGPNVTAVSTNDGNSSSEFSAPFTIEVATPTPSPIATATATPNVTVTPTSTSTAPATPAPTPTPTATPTATPIATDSATPSISSTPATTTPTPTGETVYLWGDSDCGGDISSRDNQALLRKVLDQNPLSQTEPCPDLGDTVDGRIWGDWDCDGAITARDNQALLRRVLEQAPLSQTEPCPDIGQTS